MTKLRMQFTFDDEGLRRNGFDRAGMYDMLKKNFTKRGLKCVSDDEVLAFEDQGNKSDYGHMWGLTLTLMEYDWFTDSAASIIYFQNGLAEDVLVQLPRMKEIMERNKPGRGYGR
ncbi:MAG: hypothetical protein LUG61_12340 [Lachnospiraceae bacterium]|nr:hypothetical protein [Lachnospiraceae bacterium]